MLWTERYRPSKIIDYVFVDDRHAEIIVNWIVKKEIPHLLLSGTPGVGKTTLAKIIFNELNVPVGDVLEINASSSRGIDVVRDDITRFASTMPIGDYKYILLDEADYMTTPAMMSLKNIMEQYHQFTRFILTCNDHSRIDDAIKSRCDHFHIKKTNRKQFTDRAEHVLKSEGIIYTTDLLEQYVDDTYPDLRSCIKNIQTNSVTGTLTDPSDATGEDDYALDAIVLFKQKKYAEGRKILTANAYGDDYIRLYKLLYNNLDWWSTDVQMQYKLALVIAGYAKYHHTCADAEINFSATLIEMETLI